jgi:hypothetical protein
MPTFFAHRPLLSRLFLLSVIALGTTLSPIVSQVKAQDKQPTPAKTPAPPLQMSISSPFAYQVQPLSISAKMGRWFPVGVTLSNTGDPVEGEVRLRLISSDQQNPNDFYTNVTLPTNSRKIVWLYGRMERFNIDKCQITFSGRGFKALSQQVAINEPDAEQRLVVNIADNDDGTLDMLKSLRGQGLFRNKRNPTYNPNLQPVRGVQISRELVPDRWIGLDAADVVVLGDFPHISLSPNQLDAIRGYAYSGGTLLAMGGSNATRYASSPLKDLWPMSPSNSVAATPNEVASLVSRYVPTPKNGGDRLGGAPVVLTRGILKPDALLKDGTAKHPLFSVRDTGAGRCVFLSYDAAQPPFKGWSGQGNLWQDIFQYSAKIRRLDSVNSEFLVDTSAGIQANMMPMQSEGGSATPTSSLVSSLRKIPQLRMPPVSEIAWFLSLYVFFLVPLNYAVLRFFDRRELAWISIPAIVLAFTAISYSKAVAIRGTAILSRQVDIVQSSLGQKMARTDSMMWLYSPQRNYYTLTSKGQNAVISDYADANGIKQGELSIQEPSDGNSFAIENIALINNHRAFTGQSITSLGSGISLSGRAIRNDSPLDLQGAVWIQDRRIWPLGNIKPKGSASIATEGERINGADLSGAIIRLANLGNIFDTATISSGIPAQALSVALGNDFGKLNSEALLVAWTTSPIAPIEAEGSNGRNLTLVLIRASKLTPQIALREALVSRTSFESFNGASGHAGGGFAIFDCVLPSSPNKANYILQARGIGANQGKKHPFEVWNSSAARWQPLNGTLRMENSPFGGWNFSAPIDSNWARQPDSLLRVRVRLENSNVQVSSLTVS